MGGSSFQMRQVGRDIEFPSEILLLIVECDEISMSSFPVQD